MARTPKTPSIKTTTKTTKSGDKRYYTKTSSGSSKLVSYTGKKPKSW